MASGLTWSRREIKHNVSSHHKQISEGTVLFENVLFRLGLLFFYADGFEPGGMINNLTRLEIQGRLLGIHLMKR